MTKVLLIGLGGVGQRHLRNLKSILGDEAEFLAYRVRGLQHIVTPQLKADSTKSVEVEYGVRSYTDLDEALARKPEIAVISNPNSAHIPVAQACADAGCDLFIEKPVSHNEDGLSELQRTVRERSLIAMVGYQLRYHPCFLKMREIVNGGSLGHLLGVRAMIGESLPSWHPYEDYRQMYASRSDQGGGVVLSQIHELDYLYALFGSPHRLYAIGGHWSHLELDVEDVASVLMRFEHQGKPLPVQLHQDYVQDPPSRQCEIIGDNGKLVADFRAMTVTVFFPGGKSPEVHRFENFDRNEMFLSEMREFLECVRNRTRPAVDLDDGIQSLRIALAIKESFTHDRLVEIAPQVYANE